MTTPALESDGTASESVPRKVPWWAWLFVAISIFIFIGFFLTFAIGVSSGSVD